MIENMCDIDEAFGKGLLLGQIMTHCEHVLAGGKLAAQIGCNRSHVEIAVDAIAKEGCSYIVEEIPDHPERRAVWIYKHSIAALLIGELSNKNAPSAADVVITGKLFGYADHEIENYVTGQSQVATLTATSASRPNPRCGSGIGGLRRARGCSAC
jgi:hypothetical protein